MTYITNVKTTWRKDDSWWQIYNCSQTARATEKLESGLLCDVLLFGFLRGQKKKKSPMEAYSSL